MDMDQLEAHVEDVVQEKPEKQKKLKSHLSKFKEYYW